MRRKRTTRSNWQTVFVVIFFVVLAMVARTIFLRVKIYAMDQKIENTNQQINNLEKQIADIEEEPGYNKLGLVRQLLEDTSNMPRSKHIPTLVDMLVDLQDVDASRRDKITLSDFRVSLEEIELKGEVSRLLLLYYTSEERGFTGLIDRFRALDFVENIRIQTYIKDEEEGLYEFALFANVVLDDSEE